MFYHEGTLDPPKPLGLLHCSVPPGADSIEWSRSSGKPLPAQAKQEGDYGERLV